MILEVNTRKNRDYSCILSEMFGQGEAMVIQSRLTIGIREMLFFFYKGLYLQIYLLLLLNIGTYQSDTEATQRWFKEKQHNKSKVLDTDLIKTTYFTSRRKDRT